MKGIPPFSLFILRAGGVSSARQRFGSSTNLPTKGATAPLGSRLRGSNANLECGLDYLATKTVMVLRE